MPRPAPSHVARALPLRGAAQGVAALLLATLMICTRGQHFAAVDALPSGSWAVFFLAGALLRPLWTLPLFFLLSSLLDLGSLAAGTISDWCVSPAYWALAFAYAALWLGGHVYARALHRQSWRTIPRLALALVLFGSLAYLLSKGGFYVFSGHYPDASWSGFVARIPHYYPRAIGTLAGYVGAGIALASAWQALLARRPHGASTA